MDIKNMDEVHARREMDALIAEKVMGYKLSPTGPEHYIGVNRNGNTLANIEVPRYSADIAAAWEVREHMKKNGFYGFVKDSGEYYGAFFSKIFVDENGKKYCQEGSARAKTAPLAICRAALKAVEAANGY